MPLEDIDEKFEKVAKSGLPAPDQKKLAGAPDLENETYESAFEKRKVTGLLSVFEDHLREQLKKREQEESDEEFRTVEISTQETEPHVSSKDQYEKVTPEEIESLIKISPKPETRNLKKQPTVDNTVYSQKRYDDVQEVQDITASIDDTQTSKNKPSNEPHKYTDTHPIVENRAGVDDTQVGLQPVNVTKPSSGSSVDGGTPVQSHAPEPPSTQKEVSPDVLKHIQSHRKKKQETDLPDNFVKEDKN